MHAYGIIMPESGQKRTVTQRSLDARLRLFSDRNMIKPVTKLAVCARWCYAAWRARRV